MNRNWKDSKSEFQRIEVVKALNKKGKKIHPNLTTYPDDCNKLILLSAVEAGRNVENVSIGPNACNEDSQSKILHLKATQCAVTSPANHIKTPTTTKMTRVSQRIIRDSDSSLSRNNTLTATKIIVDFEKQRRQEVQDVMRLRVKRTLALRELANKEAAEFKATLEEQSAAKALQAHEEMVQELREELQRATERKQQQELEQQLYAEKASKRAEQIREAEQRQKEVLQLKKMVEAIQKCHQEYVQAYRSLCSLIMTCKDKQALKPFLESQKLCTDMWSNLMQNCKDNRVNAEDVKLAENYVIVIKKSFSNIKEKIDEIHRKLDEEKVEEKSRKENTLTKEEKAAVTEVSQLAEPSAVTLTPNYSVEALDFVDRASLKVYQDLQDFRHRNEKLFEHILKDDGLKKFRFDCQKAVNIPVNAISPVSSTHLLDKLKKLSALLSGQTVLIGDGMRVSASAHPAGIPFCKDLLAKKFVRQGALTVSSKPEAAFAIAAVMVALWQEFPDWGMLVLAHFYEECPYLIPAFWPQLEGQSNKDYYKSLGYTYSDDGEVEKQDKFLKRMSGIMRLYAALLISRLPRDRQNKPHPHDLGQGWRWLSSLLNLEPRPDTCATVIYDFLEVAGNGMFQHYGRQFQKILLLICKEYYPRLQKITVSSSGPVVRLETFLQQILKQGFIKQPSGMLAPNFW